MRSRSNKVRKDLLESLYGNKPLLLSLDEIEGSDRAGSDLYDIVMKKVALDQGPEAGKLAASRAASFLDHLKKVGGSAITSIKSLAGTAKGPLKIGLVGRPVTGMLRDTSIITAVEFRNLTSKRGKPSVKLKFDFQSEKPRANEIEYVLSGKTWHVSAESPSLEMPGVGIIPGQRIGKPLDPSKYGSVHTDTAAHLRKTIAKFDVPNWAQSDNIRRKQQNSEEQWKRHEENPYWVVLSPGRGAKRKADVQTAIQSKLGQGDSLLRWAETQMVNVGGKEKMVYAGNPVSREDWDAFEHSKKYFHPVSD